MRMIVPFFVFILAGCYAISDAEFDARMDLDGDGIPGTEDCDDEDPSAGTVQYQDLDGDGFGTNPVNLDSCEPIEENVAPQGGDCDDEDAAVFPDAEEYCNEADDDCDGETDEGECTEPDEDGDGFDAASDCDDADPAVYPGADELCATEVDDDCDGTVNEDDAVDASTWYEDADQDGYGSTQTATVACERPALYSATNGDCDDNNAGTAPGAIETCDGEDDDCDGEVDEDFDLDGDGYLDLEGCGDGPDCDDTDPTIHEGANDPVGDGIDQDCDGDDG